MAKENANKTHQYFKCKPGIAYTFDVEEELMSVRFRFVHEPAGGMIRRFDCHCVDYRNSHVRMRFQTERNDRYTNEKNGYNSNYL